MECAGLFAASHIQPTHLYTFTASIKNTSLYTQHLQYHTTELLQVCLGGWMLFFVTNDLQCPQSPRNPLIIQHSHHYVSCIHISVCPPAAWSRFIVLFGHQSSSLILCCSCLSICFDSGHASAVSSTQSGL